MTPLRSRAKTLLGLVYLLGFTTLSSGCLVLASERFYDDEQIVFDARLLGSWKAVEDNVTVVVERSEWRSYRVRYTHPTEAGLLTGYLFKRGDALYLDLTPVRGKDFGVFVVPGHVLLQLTIAANDVTATPLSYDWFKRGLEGRSLPAILKGSRGDRDQIVIGSERPEFWQWIGALAKSEAAWGSPVTLRKEPAP